MESFFEEYKYCIIFGGINIVVFYFGFSEECIGGVIIQFYFKLRGYVLYFIGYGFFDFEMGMLVVFVFLGCFGDFVQAKYLVQCLFYSEYLKIVGYCYKNVRFFIVMFRKFSNYNNIFIRNDNKDFGYLVKWNYFQEMFFFYLIDFILV